MTPDTEARSVSLARLQAHLAAAFDAQLERRLLNPDERVQAEAEPAPAPATRPAPFSTGC